MTTPTTYPEDVTKAAHATVLAAKKECASERLLLGTGSALDVLDKHVARAIMAERKRSANDLAFAAAIRKGE